MKTPLPTAGNTRSCTGPNTLHGRCAGSALALGLALGLIGCSPEEGTMDAPGPQAPPDPAGARLAAPHPEDSDAVIREKGKALVNEAFSLLASNLMTALAAGGPSNAIPFCSVKALPLTESVAQANSIELRRVSHRVRNPGNAPTPAEGEALNKLREQHAASQPLVPMVERTAQGVTFYAPIVLNNPLCLTCHGEPGRDISPETLALLKTLYPQDEATGFGMNDLRGMWVVRVSQEAPQP